MPKGAKEAKNVSPAQPVAKSTRLLYNVAEMNFFHPKVQWYEVK